MKTPTEAPLAYAPGDLPSFIAPFLYLIPLLFQSADPSLTCYFTQTRPLPDLTIVMADTPPNPTGHEPTGPEPSSPTDPRTPSPVQHGPGEGELQPGQHWTEQGLPEVNIQCLNWYLDNC